MNIQAESWQFGGGPGSVSVSGPSGLAITTVTTPIFGPPGVTIGWYTKKSISGTVYEVLVGAGDISVQVPMSASATSSSGSMSASTWSTVSLHPAVVSEDNLVDVDEIQTAPIGANRGSCAQPDDEAYLSLQFNDSPGFEGIDLYKSLTYKADFETSFMFKPHWLSSWAGGGLNSEWVPYHISLWSATGSASRANAQASWTISLNTTASDHFSSPTRTCLHPVWSGVLGS